MLRGLLEIPKYKHGVRSMDSVLRMSALSGRMSFERSSLPTEQQLDVHQVIIDAHLVQVLPSEVNLSGVDGEVESRLGGSELALPLAAAWIAVAMTGG